MFIFAILNSLSYMSSKLLFIGAVTMRILILRFVVLITHSCIFEPKYRN